ncbi:MAG: CopD family protein [Alphaproteobacteria bacterium]|nr:CopD family protein [Alphaproteobacteria bacterium]
MMTILLTLHVITATIWVGGMFFAYVVLRPSIGEIEPPAERPRLWRRVFERFFLWVSISVLVLLATGYAMIFLVFGGFSAAGIHIHVMNATGLLMFLVYGHLRFGVWPKFRRAVDADDFTTAAAKLVSIRRIVAINLGLGWVTIVAGATGRYWL